MAAFLPNLEPYYNLGRDPKTGLPLKMVESVNYKEYCKRILRINDEQVAINRFIWHNLPPEIDGNLLERILYYKGEAMIYYDDYVDKFFCLPYVGNGNIDVYGRWDYLTPLPFNGQSSSNKKDEKHPYLSTIKRQPQYEILMDETTWEDYKGKCVIVRDYSQQMSQKIQSRQFLNDGLVDMESDLLPFLRTSLQNSTGVQGMRVGSEDEYSNVLDANKSVQQASLSGNKYVPIVGNLDFQSLTEGPMGRTEDYLEALQSMDNFRLGTMGVDNGGIFMKKQQKLQAEQQMASPAVSPIIQDGLYNRQHAMDIAFSLWGWDVFVEPAEANTGDTDGDGRIQDDSTGIQDSVDDMGGENIDE